MDRSLAIISHKNYRLFCWTWHYVKNWGRIQINLNYWILLFFLSFCWIQKGNKSSAGVGIDRNRIIQLFGLLVEELIYLIIKYVPENKQITTLVIVAIFRNSPRIFILKYTCLYVHRFAFTRICCRHRNNAQNRTAATAIVYVYTETSFY